MEHVQQVSYNNCLTVPLGEHAPYISNGYLYPRVKTIMHRRQWVTRSPVKRRTPHAGEVTICKGIFGKKYVFPYFYFPFPLAVKLRTAIPSDLSEMCADVPRLRGESKQIVKVVTKGMSYQEYGQFFNTPLGERLNTGMVYKSRRNMQLHKLRAIQSALVVATNPEHAMSGRAMFWCQQEVKNLSDLKSRLQVYHDEL